MNIFLGPAGSPAKSTLEGVRAVKELGLNAMEVEFVYGVRMSNELAWQVGEAAKKLDIRLSVHAPYYINLASSEKEKIAASKKRILESCERAHYMGARLVVFHPGFFGKRSKEDTHDMIKNALDEIKKIIRERKWNVELAPETTGKHSAFGSLEETVQIAKELACELCVDFAHIYARNAGKIDYAAVLDAVAPLHIKNLHCHFSGINFTKAGERNHLTMGKPAFEPLAKEILKRKTDITIISESPVTWKDSLKMKQILKQGYEFDF